MDILLLESFVDFHPINAALDNHVRVASFVRDVVSDAVLIQIYNTYDESPGSDSCWTCQGRYLRLHARGTLIINATCASENTGDTHTQEVAFQARPTSIRHDGHAILVSDLHDLHHVCCRIRVNDHSMSEACFPRASPRQEPVSKRVNEGTTRLRASRWAKSRARRGSAGPSRPCPPRKTPRVP